MNINIFIKDPLKLHSMITVNHSASPSQSTNRITFMIIEGPSLNAKAKQPSNHDHDQRPAVTKKKPIALGFS